MHTRSESSDVVVIGGGLAGVSAAVAAARLGSRVSLISNRPVLGGNSSSEIRVWVVGATAHGRQRFARETGIMGELFLENQFRNPEGNPYYWDQTVLDLVRAEPNLTLHLNTDVRDVELSATDRSRIEAVTGWTMGSEILTRFDAPIFIDCTGDGLVGALAGAEFRVGRESRYTYNEEWAPERADDELLGSSLFFYTKDAGRPEKFVPPSIAKDISQTPILANRIIRTGDNGCDYWWIEWGGELDTVGDNEQIRDELWGLAYGIWDYIKNSGKFDADNLTLEWVGSIPGKREYRRFVGDYTLTQNDILDQTSFDDAVAFGGWSIDLHPVEGVYAETVGALQRYSNGVYDIPFRCLYSRNIDNLLFAGRNISASHVAFGSTRVMATCSTLGEAAGTGAALAASLGITPREVGTVHLEELRAALARTDASVVGAQVTDPLDLAASATVTASSTRRRLDIPVGAATGTFLLDRDAAIVLPVEPRLDFINFTVDSDAATELQIELWDTGKPQNYVPIHRLSTTHVAVTAGDGVVVRAALDWAPDSAQNAVVIVRANPLVSLLLADERPYGVLALVAKKSGDAEFDDHIPDQDNQPIVEWNAAPLRRQGFVFSASPDTDAYAPAHVTDGYQRPHAGPRMWSSSPSRPTPGTAPAAAPAEHLQLDWTTPVTVSSVRIVFNDDVDEDLINLHHHRTEFETVPELVADYRVEVASGPKDARSWHPVAVVTANHHRHRIHTFDSVSTTGIRVVATRTNGSPTTMVSAIKVYE
ncbi:FAD-dependent oxidoreductase [Cryobacterium fucosi]|uniref:FAD-dependent oxidoreductase n=1 Tax=Cryobacterium fucosi TaxID=1259157 RepID=A0A4R9BEN3_9MICO|nr:FAD-dependent oxidoreductase [Cryobacterium fucosi]TFD82485.1 FAD-dependent oxidoreductase [Cryobacterium fucosi]